MLSSNLFAEQNRELCEEEEERGFSLPQMAAGLDVSLFPALTCWPCRHHNPQRRITLSRHRSDTCDDHTYCLRQLRRAHDRISCNRQKLELLGDED
jgi:hypothetical protein